MQLSPGFLTRRLLTVGAAFLLPLAATNAFASAATTSGNLTVTATVTSSLQFQFSNGTNGPSLTGTNASANANPATATLPFGSIVAYGTEPTGVSLVSSSTSLAVCGTCFVVSAPVNVVVTQADGSSTGFNMTAELNAADNQNYWAVGAQGTQISATAPTTIFTGGAGAYGTGGNNLNIYLGVPNGTVTTPSINAQINFAVTAQ